MQEDVDILKMGPAELLMLTSQQVPGPITTEEFMHIAAELGAFWSYDYQAAEQGRVGLHALLKSGRHSDGFFVSKILLEHENILDIMADQIVRRFQEQHVVNPNYVTGIPAGATALGRAVAKKLDLPHLELQKLDDGRIVLEKAPPPGTSVVIVEDFCTRGTGFKEAVLAITQKQPSAWVFPYDFVILNRGGLLTVSVEGVTRPFPVTAVVDKRIQDWSPEECPLCEMGSQPIKPKATDENWHALTTSQLAA